MKRLVLYGFLFCITSFLSCKEETISPDGDASSFLKVVQMNSSYIARSVIEMADGSVVLISISDLAPSEDNSVYYTTPLPAVITKYDAEGNLLWQNELPEIVQTVWHSILLANGDIAVAGFEKSSISNFMGLVLLNSSGELINQTTLFNPIVTINMNAGILNRLDMIQLQNGNIAVALNLQTSINPSNARLVIFNAALVKIFDNTYVPSAQILNGFHSQIYLLEEPSGDLIMHGRFTRNGTKNFAFDLKVQAGTYALIYQQTFIDTLFSSTSSFALSDAGSIVWASTGARTIDTLFNTWFNYRYQEYYRIAPSIKIWKSNGNPAQTEISTLTGYPKNGYIAKMKRCRDGGYILLGTCNINANQGQPSNYQVMMLKLNGSLQLEWMQFPNTNAPTVASDVIETSSGYLVSATQLSFGETNRPIIFKTTKQGIIK